MVPPIFFFLNYWINWKKKKNAYSLQILSWNHQFLPSLLSSSRHHSHTAAPATTRTDMDGGINSRLNTSACCPTYESVDILQKAIAGSFYCTTIPRQLSAHGPINQIQSTDRREDGAFVWSDPRRRAAVEMLKNASLRTISANAATTEEFVIPRHRLPAYRSVLSLRNQTAYLCPSLCELM